RITPDVRARDGHRSLSRILRRAGQLSVSTARVVGAVHRHSDHHLSADLGKDQMEPAVFGAARVIACRLLGLHRPSNRVGSPGALVRWLVRRTGRKIAHRSAPCRNDYVHCWTGDGQDACAEAYSVTDAYHRRPRLSP